MATNDFLVFGGGAGANVITQVNYSGLAARTAGFSAGVAQSAQLNKVWRQSSIMSAVLAQFISDQTGLDTLDDGTTATLLANLKKAISGRLLNVQVFTASGTYTPTPGMTFAIMRVQGGGGAGAGTQVPTPGRVSLGAPGGAGTYGVGKFLAATIGASQTVTIGAGGTAASATNGGSGGTSSVGALIVTPGGSGGQMQNSVLAPNFNSNSVLSSAATGANLYSSRGAGAGLTMSFSTAGCVPGGGGASNFGPGGSIGGSGLNGNAGVGFGSGGGGAQPLTAGAPLLAAPVQREL